MKECICNSYVSVFVNGSPTKDFGVGKDLRQKDPLAPFLFLIVAENLATLTNREAELGRLNGFNVHQTLKFRILKFIDDTIFIAEGP